MPTAEVVGVLTSASLANVTKGENHDLSINQRQIAYLHVVTIGILINGLVQCLVASIFVYILLGQYEID